MDQYRKWLFAMASPYNVTGNEFGETRCVLFPVYAQQEMYWQLWIDQKLIKQRIWFAGKKKHDLEPL